MPSSDVVSRPGRDIAADGSCETCRSKRPGGRWDGPPGLRPADIIRSVDEGCPTCALLLEGIRLLDKEWEYCDNVDHTPSFDVYEGVTPGQESVVVMLTVNRQKRARSWEKVRRTWLEFFTLPGKQISAHNFLRSSS